MCLSVPAETLLFASLILVLSRCLCVGRGALGVELPDITHRIQEQTTKQPRQAYTVKQIQHTQDLSQLFCQAEQLEVFTQSWLSAQ